MVPEARMKRALTTAALLLCFGGYARSHDDPLQHAGDAIANIPELRGLNATAVEAQAENLFREKCTRNGGPGAFENAERAKTEMVQCVQSLVNVTDLQSEIEKYKHTGDLDIVFKRYCNKRTTLRGCVTNFTDTVEQCLDEKERENKKIVLNITDSLLEFTCFKEGERIALFIAAGGPECIESKKDAIQNCINSTYAHVLPKANNSELGVDSLPSLIFNAKECRDMVSLQNCVVAELEKCSDPTTANLVNSIFNYVRRVTPCESLLGAQSAAAIGMRSSASGAAFSATLAILFAVAASLVAA